MNLIRRSATTVSKPRFETVVETELAVLYRVAKLLTSNADDAEDIVGQTLYQAAKAWNAFDGSHPRSWLIQILRNEHLQLVRKRTGKQTVPIDATLEPSVEGFWEKVDAALMSNRILEELAELPEEYRLAIGLCDVEEFSYDEAARIMGVPVGTVRSRLFRGRNLLRARLVKLQS
jgi:RNA polymerase sigma-70 factor, ECF subfamily